MTPRRTLSAQALRAVAISGLGAAVVVSSRALLRPRAGSDDRRLLNWESVQKHAHARTGETGRLFRSAELNSICDLDAVELAPLLAEVCGTTLTDLPPFVVVDRRGFIDQNIRIVQRMMEPIEKLRATLPESRLTAWGRSFTSRYMGELLGFMSRRVLGQYDPVLSLGTLDDSPTPSLYMVQPNLSAYVGLHHVDDDQLRRWIIMHELTHAWQFGAHPWLRPYLTGLISSLMGEELTRKSDSGPPRAKDLWSRFPNTLRAQLASINQVQAVMSLLEGYSNYVMNQVGAVHLENFAELEASFHKRRTQRSLLERFILAITGINMKLRQYEIGERFCTGVVAAADLKTLNRAWESAEMLPTMAELREPKRWIQRVS